MVWSLLFFITSCQIWRLLLSSMFSGGNAKTKIIYYYTMEQIVKQAIIESAKEIMAKNIVATLCTCDGNCTHANNIYFAYNDTLEIVFVSDKDTKHAENIEKNSKVSIVVYNEPEAYGSNHQGIQIHGICAQASGLNLVECWHLYTKRFPVYATMIKNVDEIAKKLVKSRIFIVKVTSLKVLDVPTFGKEFHVVEF